MPEKARAQMGVVQDSEEYNFEIRLFDTLLEATLRSLGPGWRGPVRGTVRLASVGLLWVLQALMLMVAVLLSYAVLLLAVGAIVVWLPTPWRSVALVALGLFVLWRCVIGLGGWATAALRDAGIEPSRAAEYRTRHFWLSEQRYTLSRHAASGAQLLVVFVALLGVTVLREDFEGPGTLLGWLRVFSFHFADAACLSAFSTLDLDWRTIIPKTLAARATMLAFSTGCAIGYVARAVSAISATSRLADAHRGTRLSLLDKLDVEYGTFSLDILIQIVTDQGKRAVSGTELVRAATLLG
jgi:hypothetical protein